MRPNLLLPFAVLAAIACGQTTQPRVATPAPEPAPAHILTIGIPHQVADFGFVMRHDFDDPADGVQLRYSGPDSVDADVFVYPGPDFAQRCAPACAAKQLDEEIAVFRSSFSEPIKLGYVKSIAVVSEEPLTPPSGAPWRLGRHLQLDVTRSQQPLHSEYYLFYVPGFRVKVRSTFDDSAPHRRSVDGFVSQIVPALVHADTLGSHTAHTT